MQCRSLRENVNTGHRSRYKENEEMSRYGTILKTPSAARIGPISLLDAPLPQEMHTSIRVPRSDSLAENNLVRQIEKLKTEACSWNLERKILMDKVKEVELNTMYAKQLETEIEELRASKEQSLAELQKKFAAQAEQQQMEVDEAKKRLRNEVQEMHAAAEAREREFAAAQQQVTDQLEQYRHDAAGAEAHNAVLSAEVQRLKVELESCQSKFSRESELSASNAKNCEEAYRNIRALESKLSDTEAVVEASKREIATLQLNLQSASMQLNHSKAELDAMSSKDQMIAQLTAQRDSALKLLELEQMRRRKIEMDLLALKGKIRVLCRVQPVLKPENAARTVVRVPEQTSIYRKIIIDKTNETFDGNYVSKPTEFVFDQVFGPDETNADVFAEAQLIIQSAIDGHNACIFAYGQTGSGKSYTMWSQDGIVSRAIDKIFEASASVGDSAYMEVTAEYIEIYNENLYDLLAPGDRKDREKLSIKHDSNNTTCVVNATSIRLDNRELVNNILAEAAKNRATASTKMNERSSRSHSVFMIHIDTINHRTGQRRRGNLNLIDLAGSERLRQSQVTGERLGETKAINSSLSSLGDVIHALATGSTMHVPFRNSKLTYLLQNSLTGDSRTLMIVTVSSLKENVGDTISSLMFATKVSESKLKRRS